MKRGFGILFAVCIAFSMLTVVEWWLYNHEFYFTAISGILLQLLLVWYLYRREIILANRMERMIDAIRYSDFTYKPVLKSSGEVIFNLNRQMDNALTYFRQRQFEGEARQQYYDSLLSTVDAGILVIDKQGVVQWSNEAVLRLLSKERLEHVDDLHSLHPNFPNLLLSLRPGKTEVILIDQPEGSCELAVTGSSFVSQDNELMLISLKNIHSVLEENEIEAWQKLIRILTHEIMNSIAPIISLSETVTERAESNGMNKKDYEMMLQSMQVIHRRSKGLLGFVENYRKLTKIPVPKLEPLFAESLFSDIRSLFPDDTASLSFVLSNPRTELFVDRSQIEQVLINLIKNAQEAGVEGQQLRIHVEGTLLTLPHCYQITVSDNGRGIVPEAIDKVFIPFFTTKTNGSGIGLSLCKQIMSLHGGTISVTSSPGKGSVFTLRFYNFNV
ncbi:MAG: ATP-binding protein [Bacteroidales bacterium]|nr:ATP-binding protein [Bacteroidales bacterium]